MALRVGNYVSSLWGRLTGAEREPLRDQAQKLERLARDTQAEFDALVTVPEGAIVMFDDRDTCPTGWSLVTAFVGRFPRGVSSGAGTDGGSDSHSHGAGTLATGVAGAQTVFQWGTGSTDTASDTSHTHSITGSTASADNIPAFRQVIFCKKD